MLEVHVGAEKRILLVLPGHADLSGKSVGMDTHTPFARGFTNAPCLHPVILGQCYGEIRRRRVRRFNRRDDGEGRQKDLYASIGGSVQAFDHGLGTIHHFLERNAVSLRFASIPTCNRLRPWQAPGADADDLP